MNSEEVKFRNVIQTKIDWIKKEVDEIKSSAYPKYAKLHELTLEQMILQNLLRFVPEDNSQSEVEELRKKMTIESESADKRYHEMMEWKEKWLAQNHSLELKDAKIDELSEGVAQMGLSLVALQSELATAKRERDAYFDELHAKRQELASVKSELENLQEDHKILHNNYHVQAEDEIELKANNKILGDNVTCLRKQLLEITDELKDAEVEANQYRALYETTLSDNKRLSDVVEGIKESLFELNNDTSFEFVIGKVYESIKLIASLETK